MRCRQLLDLFTRHTLEACIEGMSLNRDVGKTQPAVQGLGINGKQTTTVGQRHDGHQENSFRVQQNKKQDRSLGSFQGICSGDHQAILKHEQAILLSGDACGDNSPPNTDALGESWTTDKSEAREWEQARSDRKSTRLNSSHLVISYAVFCLKK